MAEAMNCDVLVTVGDKRCAGQHIIVDLWQMSDRTMLSDKLFIHAAMKKAAEAARAQVLHVYVHAFCDDSMDGSAGEFGMTGVAVLAESHISIHTWPELDYIAIDIFMCGNSAPEKAMAVLLESFQPARHEVQTLLRGVLD